MRYRTLALIVTIGTPIISVATGLAVGLDLTLALVLAAASGTLGGSIVAVVWLLGAPMRRGRGW